METLLGIDIGRTNTKVTILRNGLIETLPAFQSNGIFSSSFYIDSNKNLIFGNHYIKSNELKNPEKSFSSVLKIIDEMQNGGSSVESGFSYNEVIIEYFLALKRESEKCLHEVTKNIILTIPESFTLYQNQLLINSATSAGFNVISVLNEHISALIYFIDTGILSAKDGYYLVYDLGGGSFKISIIRMNSPLSLIAYGGDNYIGGEELTKILAITINNRISLYNDTNNSNDKSPFFKELLDKAEFLKCRLSINYEEVLFVNLPDNNNFQMCFRREEIEELFTPLIDKTFELTQKLLIENGINKNDILKIILIGGSASIPLIKNIAEEEQYSVLNTNETQSAISKGAAIYGKQFFERKNNNSVEKNSFSSFCRDAHPFLSLDDQKNRLLDRTAELKQYLFRSYFSVEERDRNNFLQILSSFEDRMNHITNIRDLSSLSRTLNDIEDGFSNSLKTTQEPILHQDPAKNISYYSEKLSYQLLLLQTKTNDSKLTDEIEIHLDFLNKSSEFTHNSEYLIYKLIEVDKFIQKLTKDLKFTDEIENTINDEVYCTVFSPPEVKCGESILVQVFAHQNEKSSEAEMMAKEFDEETFRRGFTSLNTKIQRDNILTFELILQNIKIDDNVQHLTWKGKTESVQFEVKINDNHLPGNLIGKVLVSQKGIPIGHIRFKIKITEKSSQKTGIDNIVPTGQAKKYNKAFISYASKDREEVLRRVQMLSITGIKYFQDIMNLEPGDKWSQMLYKQIDEADVFFLFWSKAASNSLWVSKEIKYALERKRGVEDLPPDIIPVPIERPIPNPPEELRDIHFNDKFIYFIDN